jgi:hypothetical protein
MPSDQQSGGIVDGVSFFVFLFFCLFVFLFICFSVFLFFCFFVFLFFCFFVFLALFIDLVTDQVQPLSRCLIPPTYRPSTVQRDQTMPNTRPWSTAPNVRAVYTCWWYSLCNFQYRHQYEKTGSDHVDC